jgi:hypothetical protein
MLDFLAAFYFFFLAGGGFGVLVRCASKEKTKVLPSPSLEQNVMSPPRFFATLREILKPRPLPLGFLFLLCLSEDLKNGEKSLSASYSLNPMPLS